MDDCKKGYKSLYSPELNWTRQKAFNNIHTDGAVLLGFKLSNIAEYFEYHSPWRIHVTSPHIKEYKWITYKYMWIILTYIASIFENLANEFSNDSMCETNI